MAHRTYRSGKTQKSTAKTPIRKPLKPENRAVLAFLQEWMSTPDEMGDEWWDEFEKDLKANRLSFHRTD